MAFASVGTLGNNPAKAANASTKVLTTTATAEAGNLVVVIVAVDNAGTVDGDEGAVTSITDSAGGNTWTKAIEYANSEGAAQAGSVTSIWFSKLTNQIASGGTITANFSNATERDAHIITAWEFTCSGTVSVEGTPFGGDNSGFLASRNVTTANVECIRIRAASYDSNDAAIATPTSGWTEIFDGPTTGSGGGASHIDLFAEFIISTGTGAASLPNPSLSRVYADVYVALKETIDGAGSASGSGAASGDGAKITAATGRSPDNFIPTFLLAHCEGTDGSQSYTAETGQAFTFEQNSQIDTAQAKFGTSSFLFTTASTERIIGPSIVLDGDFTIDFWTRPAATPAGLDRLVHLNGGGNFYINLDNNNFIQVVPATGWSIQGAIAIANNTWHHIAVTRAAGVVRLFVNGTADGSATAGETFLTEQGISFGNHRTSSGSEFSGWMDEIRIIKGRAVWTAGFVVPTVAYNASVPGPILLLHADGADGSTTIVDSTGRHTFTASGNAQIDTAQSKFGGSAFLFDGTNDYLTGDGGFSFAGDFTIEFWVRLANLDFPEAAYCLIDFRSSATDTTSGGPVLTVRGDNFKIECEAAGSGGMGATTTTLAANTWYHVALTRNGDTVRLFVDGTLDVNTAVATQSISANANRPRIGARADLTQELNGWIDEVRIIDGVALYTSSFTAPSAPFTTEKSAAIAIGEAITASDQGAGNAAGTGTAAATGTAVTAADGAATGTGTASATGASTAAADGAADGAGDATATGTAVTAADGAASGAGTADATGETITVVEGTGAAAGAGDAAAVGASTATADGAVDGTGAASGVGAATAAADGAAAGTGDAAGAAETLSFGTADGAGTATATGTAVTAADGAAAGAGTGAATGFGLGATDGVAAGTGTASATGTAITAADGAAAGTGDATATGAATAAADGAAAGDGTATGDGQTLADGVGVGQATGAGAASATGASTAASDAAAAGTGTATATGAAIFAGDGAAAGSGAAAGDGQTLTSGAGVGQAAGTGTASATGASTAASDGAAAGAGTANAASVGIVAGDGAAAGAGDASAVGEEFLAGSVGTAAGTGAAAAIGSSIATGIGSAPGVGVAVGVARSQKRFTTTRRTVSTNVAFANRNNTATGNRKNLAYGS